MIIKLVPVLKKIPLQTNLKNHELIKLRTNLEKKIWKKYCFYLLTFLMPPQIAQAPVGLLLLESHPRLFYRKLEVAVEHVLAVHLAPSVTC